MTVHRKRILSRGVLLDKAVTKELYTSDKAERELINLSMAAYMLADGKEIKIMFDGAMGGTVVEYDDGK